MKKYEYHFAQVPAVPEQKGKDPVCPFDTCREIICNKAADGWRLKQIVEPRMSVYGANFYQIIFEREAEW